MAETPRERTLTMTTCEDAGVDTQGLNRDIENTRDNAYTQ